MIATTPSRSLWRIYALEAKYEFLKQMRLPAYVVPSLAFPLVFYFMFGVALPHGHGAVDIPTYMLATYGAFGVMNVSLFGFGVGVAIERGQGWMLFKRASPMPPFAYFTAKLATVLLFSLIMAS
jgi:ABC-2 type transport system permease protein